MRPMHSATALTFLTLLPLVAVAQPAPAPAPTPAPIAAPTPTADAATTLPAVTVATDTPVAENTDAAPAAPKISLGTTPISVFFTPLQMQAVREALSEYEARATTTGPKTELDVNVAGGGEPIQVTEPSTYPVFYLSSIVYKSPGDWSLWVSGHKITSQKNNTDLQVLAVSANQASFAWKPVYADALATRSRMNLLAPTAPVKNKLTPTPSFKHDLDAGVVHFTLRPNQSFLPAYMNTFEGFLASPALPAMKAEGDVAASPSVSPNSAQAPANANTPLAQRSPTDMLQGISASASRAEIDAQLKRAADRKKQ